jgi:D-alanyl-D-alanine carboxypeptidase
MPDAGNGRAHRVFLGVAAILSLTIALAGPVWAAPADNSIFATRARSAVLMDGDTGEPLAAQCR